MSTEQKKDPPVAVKITAENVIDFFMAKQRSAKCPACPHDGDWSLVVDEKTPGPDREMVILNTPIEFPGGVRYGAVISECPQCGFIVLTSVIAILSWLAEAQSKDGQNG